MSVDQSRVVAWLMWVWGPAMIVLAAMLAEMNPPISTTQAPESALEGAIWLSTWVGFGLVSALVVSSRPANRIGWLMCGITFVVGVDLLVSEYSRFALITEPGSGSLRDRVDSEEVVDGWVGVVAETMQTAAAGVWVRVSR